ncbi:hypothetical protein BA059_16725 [Mycolicibacterium sp. (ex Dasyatis americana)]|nr:hypothetical protein BA059_16725 [Mycolicibacterium sp. (ex Dasyatis americana)]
MNATDDGDPLGEGPIDTLAVQRAAELGFLAGADLAQARAQLAERQTQALNKVRELHRPLNMAVCDACDMPLDDDERCLCDDGCYTYGTYRVCEECRPDEDGNPVEYPCPTIRAIDEAGA